jgi:hypothetical protein
VAHALAAHLGPCYLNAALVANFFLVAVFDAFIFAAAAFPVLDRPEYALAKQSAAFGLQGTVVDGFGLGYFALGPFRNFPGEAMPICMDSKLVSSNI